MHTKFIIVLGSLMSGLGKGAVTSSLLKILSMYGYKVLPIKFDGYLNYDCGTMNPYRHGEVFVLDDGGEVDMDFGMYERFLNKNLTKASSITGGKLMDHILKNERAGKYLGEDVQIIPHLTDEIKKLVLDFASKNKLDFVIIEVGGTVGDIENSYFIEAMRQLSTSEDLVFIDVTYIPKLNVVGEQKTKPAQSAFRLLMGSGITPDFIVCRSEERLEDSTIRKLSLFANLPKERIVDSSDLNTVYELPLHFIRQGFDKRLLYRFGMKDRKINKNKLIYWQKIVRAVNEPKNEPLSIGIVGKYTHLRDSYVSVKEAITHSSAKLHISYNLKWIEAEDIESAGPEKILAGLNGIIVPGGFGKRGIEGMITAIRYARENKIPFLGLCLGMQLMSIEFARNVCGLKGANSSEFNKNSKYKVIDLMPEQRSISDKGASMRLGALPIKVLKKGSIIHMAYNNMAVSERHRHRYEINNRYRPILNRNGLVISAVTPDRSRVEAVEWKGSFGIGTQSHPELKSRPESPAPLFVSFLNAASANAEE